MNIALAISSHFDRQAIITPAQRAEKKFLGNMGGFCRKVAQNSIRTRKGISQAGDPPFGHDGRIKYKSTILYAVDSSSHAVFIGPVPIGGGRLISPEIIEYGGDELIQTGRPNRLRQRMASFAARPHMRPALIKTIESPQFEAALKDCVINEAGTSVSYK